MEDKVSSQNFIILPLTWFSRKAHTTKYEANQQTTRTKIRGDKDSINTILFKLKGGLT